MEPTTAESWRLVAEGTKDTSAGLERLADALADCPDVPALVAHTRAWALTAPDAAARIIIAAHHAGHQPTAAQVAPLLPMVSGRLAFVGLLVTTPPEVRLELVVDLLSNRNVSDRWIAAGLVLCAFSLPSEDVCPSELRDALWVEATTQDRIEPLTLLLAAARHLGDGVAAETLLRRGADPFWADELTGPLAASAVDLPINVFPVREPLDIFARPAGTVRREQPKIGRNDPCWCGSGKKYKRCHAGRGDDRQPVEVAPAKPEPRSVSRLGVAELLRLDPERMSQSDLNVLCIRLAELNYWDEAVRAATVVAADQGSVGRERLVDLAECLVSRGDLARAGAFIAAHDLEGDLPAACRYAIALNATPPSLDLAGVSELFGDALALEDSDLLFDLARACEFTYPPLAVLFARAAFDPGQPLETALLDDVVCRVRARLGVDPSGDPFSARRDSELPDWARAPGAPLGAEVSPELRADTLEEEVVDAHRRVADLGAELERKAGEARALQRELAEEREARARAERLDRRRAEREASAPDPGVVQRARDRARERALEDKLSHLEGVIRERNIEKRRLTRRLDQLERHAAGRQRAAEAPAAASDRDGGGAFEAAEAPAALPDGGVRVPVFSAEAEGAARADGRIGSAAVVLAARIAVRDEGAWREVKKLGGFNGLFSTRVGLHHRLLFTLGDRTLDVVDLIDRQDQDRRLTQLRARGL